MNLEKLGLTLFLKASQEHKKIVEPLKLALKNVVVAGLQSAQLVQTATLESEVLKPYGSAHKTLKQFDLLSHEVLNWINQNQDASASKKIIMRQIVEEIVLGLDDEKKNILKSDYNDKEAQIQALTAIVQALEKRFLDKNDAPKSQKSASKNDL